MPLLDVGYFYPADFILLYQHIKLCLPAFDILLSDSFDLVLVIEVLQLIFVLDQLLRNTEFGLELLLGLSDVAFPETYFVDRFDSISATFQNVVHLVFLF